VNSAARDRGVIAVRYTILMIATWALVACASDVTMHNPRTGETKICRGAPGGIDPWSQNYSCAANLAAQGWRQITDPTP
jgi:hypothetical protein